MIRLWRSLIGIAWGTIVGAIAMHFIGMIFGYNITLINCIVYGIPILTGFITGVSDDWWLDVWMVFLFPILSLYFVVIILIALVLIALIYNNPLHLLWIIPVIGLFIPPTEYIILILKK